MNKDTLSWKKEMVSLGLKYGLAILIVFFLGAALEYFYHVPLLRQENRGVFEISLDQVSAKGFERRQEGFVLVEDEGTLTVPLGGQYVEQFAYFFDYDHLLNAKAYVCYYNEYGQADPNQDLLVEDRNNKLADASYLSIRKKVDSIVLSIDKSELGEPGTREEAADVPLAITGLAVCNALVINGCRLAFFWLVSGLFAFFWLFRGYLARHVETGFLVVSLSVGAWAVFAFTAAEGSRRRAAVM